MKKRIISACIVAATCCLLAIPAAADGNRGVSDIEKWGDSIQKYTETVTNQDEAIMESLKPAENGKIILPQTEIDMAKDFYISAGYGEAEAERLALQYVKEINVLYQEAFSNGYTASDQEIREHLDSLKEQYQTAENKEEMQAFMDKFENEQAYWDYQFEIYKKDLPIQKYNADREKKYLEEQTSEDGQTERLAIQGDWEEEFEYRKKAAVEESDFVVR